MRKIWTGCESESDIDKLFHLVREVQEGGRGGESEADWRRAETWLGLVESGCSLLLRLGGIPPWGAKMAARSPTGTAVLSVRSLSHLSRTSRSPSEGCLFSCFGLSCLLSLEGGTDVRCTEQNVLEVNNLTPDLLGQNPSALQRCLRSQKMLKLSIKFTD